MKKTATNPGFFSPSGGLVWHARALRNRSSWRVFRAALSAWLEAWPHGRKKLLLLGPSAGWCMPTRFLGSFSEIHAVDFDPLAPFFFSVLHGWHLRRQKTAISWCRSNFIRHLEQILREHPEHAVLFGNTLGQHRLHCADIATAEADISALAEKLQGRPWASFHDRLSGAWNPCRTTPRAFSCRGRLPSAHLAIRYDVAVEWTDHLTEGLLPADTPCLYLPWRLEQSRLHIVEAGWRAG
ncbi:MAG: hypothetical protein EBT83_09670 [Betaproteobacteria bacterium]|nr:hypothetical protein [Betaproteobacteria bacterium]